MRRLALLLLLWAALASEASAQETPHTVLMLLYRGMTDAEKGFIAYLRPRMRVDFIIRDAGGDPAKIKEFVAEARRTRPSLIYTFGTTVTLDTVGALGKIDPERHITDIPVVFNIVADPVGAGLSREMAPTGRNLTGVSHLVPMSSQLKTMQRFKPVASLGVVYNPREANSVLTIGELRKHAAAFGYKLVEAPLVLAAGQRATSADIEAATHELLQSRVDFIYLPSDSSLIQHAAAITGPAKAANVPVISATEAPIREHGALVGLVSSYYNAGEYAGHKAEQILMGKKAAGSIPIDTLQRFSLVVNMNTAQSLQAYPPMDLVPIAELLLPVAK